MKTDTSVASHKKKHPRHSIAVFVFWAFWANDIESAGNSADEGCATLFFFVPLHTASWRVPSGGGKFDHFFVKHFNFFGRTVIPGLLSLTFGVESSGRLRQFEFQNWVICGVWFLFVCVLLVTAASVAKLSREIINVLVSIKKKFQF